MIATLFAFFFSLFRTFTQMPGTGRLGGAQVPLLEDHDTAGALGDIVESDGSGSVQLVERWGRFDDYNENNVVATTTSTVFATHVSLVVDPAKEAGDYDIHWHYVISHSNTSGDPQVKVRLAPAGVTGPLDLNEPATQGHTQIGMTKSTNRVEYGGAARVTMLAGADTIEMQIARIGTGTMTIHRGALSIQKVG